MPWSLWWLSAFWFCQLYSFVNRLIPFSFKPLTFIFFKWFTNLTNFPTYFFFLSPTKKISYITSLNLSPLPLFFPNRIAICFSPWGQWEVDGRGRRWARLAWVWAVFHCLLKSSNILSFIFFIKMFRSSHGGKDVFL